jgi:CPA2 family monovalent cation:H+ antiporter-2
MGVYEAVQPEFEAGLELGRQALIHMGFGAVEIQRFSDSVRHELYAPISNPEGDGNLAHLNRAARMIESDWIELPDQCGILGRTIGDLHIRGRTGASIVALVRGDEVVTNPGPDLELAPGDTLSVLGTTEQRSAFLALMEDPDGEPRSP